MTVVLCCVFGTGPRTAQQNGRGGDVVGACSHGRSNLSKYLSHAIYPSKNNIQLLRCVDLGPKANLYGNHVDVEFRFWASCHSTLYAVYIYMYRVIHLSRIARAQWRSRCRQVGLLGPALRTPRAAVGRVVFAWGLPARGSRPPGRLRGASAPRPLRAQRLRE